MVFSKQFPELAARLLEALDRSSKEMTPSAEDLRSWFEVAMELRRTVGDRAERFDDVDNENGGDVGAWLVELPYDLAEGGLVDEAAELGVRWAEVFTPENFLPDRAVILAEAGRCAEALAAAEGARERMPDDPWVHIKAGDACLECGDAGRAEELFRQGLALAASHYERDGALERLLPMLKATGREEEARSLAEAALSPGDGSEHQALSIGDELPGDDGDDLLGAPVVPYQRSGPKVGRNEPCPCGSGKKYKKCCLK